MQNLLQLQLQHFTTELFAKIAHHKEISHEFSRTQFVQRLLHRIKEEFDYTFPLPLMWKLHQQDLFWFQYIFLQFPTFSPPIANTWVHFPHPRPPE
jgi:hypothetical protein